MVLALFTRKSVKEAAESRQVWESMALDATRARMDQSAPRVALQGAHVPAQLFAFSQGATSNTYTNEWPAGHTWVFDKDASDIICLKLVVDVLNGSPLPVDIVCSGDFYWNSQPQGQTGFVVPPGGTFQVQMQAAFTAKQWVENFEARRAGEPFPWVATSRLIMVEASENGVNDEWELKLSGCPVEPVQGNIAAWRVGAQGLDGNTAFSISPRQRWYFFSRAQSTMLPNNNSMARQVYGPGTEDPQFAARKEAGWERATSATSDEIEVR
jgi:hypothetical protein